MREIRTYGLTRGRALRGIRGVPLYSTMKIDAGSYAFTSLDQLKGIDAVLDLAFENLVVNHYREILPRLGPRVPALVCR